MTPSVRELVEQGISQTAACAALGLPRSNWYRWRQPQSETGTKSYPTPARALSTAERENVYAVLNGERFQDASPRQVYATLLDEGVYHCSISTMYRILQEKGASQERRPQRQHPAYVKPELLATAPNQLWSWDITKLKGTTKLVYYYLYVVLDVFSRYVVGWMIAECESAELAEELIVASCCKQGIERGQLTLHADRGGPMIAQTLTQKLVDLGVTKTHSRPYTPNDNPFSESQFKTMKYRPDYPERFDNLETSLVWGRQFFPWYNNEHRHSSLGLMTPYTVHYGLDSKLTARRQATLLSVYERHPERFVHGPPTPPQLPAAVWINPPVMEKGQGEA
jgi:putative transposase